jgi:microcystin-dependent protein
MTLLPNSLEEPASRRGWLKKLGGLVTAGLLLGKSQPAAARTGQQVASPLGVSGQTFLGEIMLVSFNFAPKGWALCNGQLLPINQNQALFALLGTTYGGNGQTNFGLPDLRSRIPICFGQGAGLTNRNLGDKAGTETVTLTTAQIAHTHTIPASTAIGTTSEAGTTGPKVRNYLADNGGGSAQYSTAANVTMAADAVTSVGGGQPHNNLQPVLGLNFVIALSGIFPSQN